MGAARSFRELGKAGQREGVKAQGMGQENWPYPYLHNPFAIVAYYMDAEAPHFPSLERSASDYEIKWKDKGIETIVRALLEKDSGPVMSSDLDRYESFYVVGWLGDFYRIGMGDRMMEIPSDGLATVPLRICRSLAIWCPSPLRCGILRCFPAVRAEKIKIPEPYGIAKAFQSGFP